MIDAVRTKGQVSAPKLPKIVPIPVSVREEFVVNFLACEYPSVCVVYLNERGYKLPKLEKWLECRQKVRNLIFTGSIEVVEQAKKGRIADEDAYVVKLESFKEALKLIGALPLQRLVWVFSHYIRYLQGLEAWAELERAFAYLGKLVRAGEDLVDTVDVQGACTLAELHALLDGLLAPPHSALVMLLKAAETTQSALLDHDGLPPLKWLLRL